MEIYILKSAAILTVLFAFYKVFLENTSIHNFKRFYLFGSLLAAFLIPLITFTSYVEVSPIIATYTEATPQVTHTEIEKTIKYWSIVLWTVYGMGVLFFGIKFFRNLFNLIQQIRKNPKYKNTPFINVLLNETVIPHTFFNYIFLNKKQFENREIPQEVIFHEETHARQKHSLDILFVALLQIVFWFNPLFYFIKKSIKLNHEFLADRAVLNAGAKISEYQKILLAFSSNAVTPSLAHSLNYSSIKKRFTVMKTHTSQRAIWLRCLLILPLLSVLIYGFSSKEIIQKSAEKTELANEKATDAEIAEYNKLAKKYNAVAIEDRKIPLEDLNVLETIYRKMTDEQKANADAFPECPNLTARSLDIEILKNGFYNVNGLMATKKTLLKTVENFHQDLNPALRNKILNIHIQSKNKIANEEISFLYYALKGYGFYRMVAPKQEIIPSKGNTPMKKETKKDSTVIYFKNKVITREEAEELAQQNKILSMDIIKSAEGINKVIITEKPNAAAESSQSQKNVNNLKTLAENGHLYMVPQAPPAPNPDPVEYVKELGKRGATFYIGPHKYSTDEAIELVQKSKEATIDVSKYPEVHLGGC